MQKNEEHAYKGDIQTSKQWGEWTNTGYIHWLNSINSECRWFWNWQVTDPDWSILSNAVWEELKNIKRYEQ